MKPNVYIGVCKSRYQMGIWVEVRDIVINNLRQAGVYGGGFEWSGARIDWNSNNIVKNFLKTDGTHLLMIENDVKIPAKAPMQLLAFDKPIVGALVFHRGQYWPIMMKLRGIEQNEWGHDTEIFDPMYDDVYKFLNEKKIPMADDCFFIEGNDGLQECDVVSMGCTLIKREVFEKLPGPWYTFPESHTQDIAFCRYAKKDGGFSVFCDMGSLCGHYQEIPTGPSEFRQLYERGNFHNKSVE